MPNNKRKGHFTNYHDTMARVTEVTGFVVDKVLLG
jgi:hypothetical protein